MADIHIQTETGEQLSFPEELIVDLLKSGRLSPGAYYWREGMVDWEPLATYRLPVRFSSRKTEPVPIPPRTTGAPRPAPRAQLPADPMHLATAGSPVEASRATPSFIPPARSGGGRRFRFRRNPQPLTLVLQLLLLAGVAINLAVLAIAWTRYGEVASAQPPINAMDVLTGAIHQSTPIGGDAVLPEGFFTDAPEAGTARHLEWAGWAVDLALIPSYFIWLYRTSINCRNFSSVFRLTPGWAVGVYFVPFLNLFRPCQSMQEIWRVSRNPRSWMKDRNSAFVIVWWVLGLITIAMTAESHALFAIAHTRNDALEALLFLITRKGMEAVWLLLFLTLVTVIILRQNRVVAESRPKKETLRSS